MYTLRHITRVRPLSRNEMRREDTVVVGRATFERTPTAYFCMRVFNLLLYLDFYFLLCSPMA